MFDKLKQFNKIKNVKKMIESGKPIKEVFMEEFDIDEATATKYEENIEKIQAIVKEKVKAGKLNSIEDVFDILKNDSIISETIINSAKKTTENNDGKNK